MLPVQSWAQPSWRGAWRRSQWRSTTQEVLSSLQKCCYMHTECHQHLRNSCNHYFRFPFYTYILWIPANTKPESYKICYNKHNSTCLFYQHRLLHQHTCTTKYHLQVSKYTANMNKSCDIQHWMIWYALWTRNSINWQHPATIPRVQPFLMYFWFCTLHIQHMH